MTTLTKLFTTEHELTKYCSSNNIYNNKSLLIQVLTGTIEISFIQYIQSILNKLFPSAVIIGTTTNGSIMEGEVIADEQTVLVFSQFENSILRSHILKHTSNKHFTTGKLLAKEIVIPNTKVIISFSDGIKTNGDDYLAGLNSIDSSVIISGGMAGDHTRLIDTFVFDKQSIINNGAVAVSITNPDLIVHTNYSFNWIPIGKKMIITKSIKNHVYEIDNQPVHDIYAKYLGKGIAHHMKSGALGLPITFEKNGVLIGRAVVEIKNDGSFIFAGNIDEGTEVRFGIGNIDLMLKEGIENIKPLYNEPIESIFAYSCCGRHGFLGDAVENELKPLAQIASTAGFFTNGEFFYSENKTQFLNQTLTIIALSENKYNTQSEYIQNTELAKPMNMKSSLLLALANLTNSVTGELELLNSNLENVVNEKTKHILSQVYTDNLTKLPNRLELINKLDGRDKNSLMLINIDDFTSINDYFGHSLGDYILTSLADILREYFANSNATVYKLPSDEYAVIYENVISTEVLKSNVKSLIKYIHNLTFKYKQEKIQISVTIGAALIMTSTIGIRHADLALKHAKREHVPYIIFENTDELSDKMEQNIQMASITRIAIKNNKIIPYYQPIINLKTNEIHSQEALARLVKNDESVIGPHLFIPTAQKMRMYSKITYMIFDQIVLDILKYRINFSVNLSIEDILDQKTRKYLLKKLSQNDIAKYLTFEILETQEIEDDLIINKFIKDVQNIGAKIAIDDFGSGFANFQHMTRIKANTMKIDGSLIKIVDTDQNARLVVETIVAFARKLNMKIVAEHIHSKEVLDVVKEIGIDYGQGFYLAEPSKEITIK